jgi:hypothetical protein
MFSQFRDSIYDLCFNFSALQYFRARRMQVSIGLIEAAGILTGAARTFRQWVKRAIKMTMGMGTPRSKSRIERTVSLLQFQPTIFKYRSTSWMPTIAKP